MRISTKFPKTVIFGISLVTLFFLVQIPKITLDNELTNFIPEKHPTREAWGNMTDEFGGQTIMVIGLQNPYESIINSHDIPYILNLTELFIPLEGVEDVTSLTNIDYVYGNQQGMVVDPLVPEGFQGTEQEILEIKKRVLNWEMYDQTLLSSDYRSTQIMLRLSGDGTEEFERVYKKVLSILEENPNPKIETYLAGNPVITSQISMNMKKDMVLLIPLVLLVVFLSLLIAFRQILGILLPLINVTISTIWTLGLMALLQVPLSIVGTIIPVLMIAVGSAYGIHVVTHYLEKRKNGMDDNKKAVEETLQDVGAPVKLAGLTTIAGFGSLAVSQVLPMRTFGIFTAVGVLSALFIALFFLPALLIIFPSRVNKLKENQNTEYQQVFMKAYGHFSRKKAEILLLFVLFLGIGILGTSRMQIDNILIDYFKKGTPLVEADNFLNKEFAGTNNFYLRIYGEKKGDLADPDLLKVMDNLATYLEESEPYVTKVLSFSDLIKRMNQSMNITTEMSMDSVREDSGWASDDWSDEDWSGDDWSTSEDNWDDQSWVDPAPQQKAATMVISNPMETTSGAKGISYLIEDALARGTHQNVTADELIELIYQAENYQGANYYEIPQDLSKYPVDSKEGLKNLISQYLLLFSGDLDSWVDDSLEPKEGRMAIQLSTASERETARIEKNVMEYVNRNFPEGIKVETAGIAMIQGALTNMIVSAQINSILVSIFLVFLILWFHFKSPFAGFIGIIPLSFAILINFGIMGLTGIKLDISTAMVASIAIGIGIDYTIHFLTSYKRERQLTDDLEEVTRKTLKITGKAIFFNAMSVGLGFAVLLLSQFNPLIYLGALIAITMGTSSLGSVTILPILLYIFKPKFLLKDTTKGA